MSPDELESIAHSLDMNNQALRELIALLRPPDGGEVGEAEGGT